MGTTLTGTTPQDTYDSLIKVTDNGPLSGTLKALSDGLGNDSTLSLSTTAASIAGTLAVTGSSTFSSTTAVASTGGTSQMRIDRSGSVARMQNYDTGQAANISLQHDGGLVGINTSAPSNKLSIGSPTADASQSQTYAGNNDQIGVNASYVPSGTFPRFFDIVASGAADGTNGESNIRFFTNGVTSTTKTEKLRILANGGITFNGDTAAANALDDYEEGTWTPTVVGTTTAGTATYGGGQSGLYTKIGRMVYISIYLSYSGGTGTGNLRIAGLPFTIASVDVPSITIGAVSNIALTALYVPFASGVPLSTQISIEQLPVGGGTQSLVAYDGAGVIVLSGFYQV
jgi:hypothetical protein